MLAVDPWFRCKSTLKSPIWSSITWKHGLYWLYCWEEGWVPFWRVFFQDPRPKNVWHPPWNQQPMPKNGWLENEKWSFLLVDFGLFPGQTGCVRSLVILVATVTLLHLRGGKASLENLSHGIHVWYIYLPLPHLPLKKSKKNNHSFNGCFWFP